MLSGQSVHRGWSCLRLEGILDHSVFIIGDFRFHLLNTFQSCCSVVKCQRHRKSRLLCATPFSVDDLTNIFLDSAFDYVISYRLQNQAPNVFGEIWILRFQYMVYEATWWSPLFELTKTSSGLKPGGFVARQKPSESTLLIDVGGNIEMRHGPSEQSAGRLSRQPLCTYVTPSSISSAFVSAASVPSSRSLYPHHYHSHTPCPSRFAILILTILPLITYLLQP